MSDDQSSAHLPHQQAKLGYLDVKFSGDAVRFAQAITSQSDIDETYDTADDTSALILR